ncbi:MAG: phosphosulfolactate synthase [Bacillota bacterium]
MTQQNSAFAGVIIDPLAGRSAKPRTAGQTMVIDKGLGLSQTGDLLELGAGYIDFMKFGFGTAALYRSELLKAKIDLIRSYEVEPYPGGTFLEVAWLQGRLAEYLRVCDRLGFRLVEVSDGTITLTPAERQAIIRAARDWGFAVITEIGKKDDEVDLDPIQALRQIRADLEAGATKVIVEGRESGKGVGIYDAAGKAKEDDLEIIVAGLESPDVLMWETPMKEQQQAMITRFGPNANLGNIAPADVIALEALRRGLRGDTLKLALTQPAVRGVTP